MPGLWPSFNLVIYSPTNHFIHQKYNCIILITKLLNFPRIQNKNTFSLCAPIWLQVPVVKFIAKFIQQPIQMLKRESFEIFSWLSNYGFAEGTTFHHRFDYPDNPVSEQKQIYAPGYMPSCGHTCQRQLGWSWVQFATDWYRKALGSGALVYQQRLAEQT